MSPGSLARWPMALVVGGWLACGAAASAGTIDTARIEADWPRQRVQVLEVGRWQVRWRQRGSRSEGVFAGVRFISPLALERMWERSSDFTAIGAMTPGVSAVRVLEESPPGASPRRRVIQVDVTVLWKTLPLRFEIEEEPPRAMRFRLANAGLGEYRGVCILEPEGPAASGQGSATAVELSTWLKTARPISPRLLLFIERVTMLHAVKAFLASCEAAPGDARRR